MLHLVGCLRRCTGDAWSHRHQIYNNFTKCTIQCISNLSGGCNYTFCAIIYILLVFLNDTLMMVAEASETFCWIIWIKHLMVFIVWFIICINILLSTAVKINWYSLRWPVNPYRTAFPYGNGMVLHFYQQQESSTTKTVHKVINKGLKTYV